MDTDRLNMLLRWHEEDPGDAFTRFALASEYAKLGEDEKARTFYEALATERPGYTGTWYHLGMLHERAGRRGEAAEIFRRGISEASRAGALKDLAELRSALLELEA